MAEIHDHYDNGEVADFPYNGQPFSDEVGYPAGGQARRVNGDR